VARSPQALAEPAHLSRLATTVHSFECDKQSRFAISAEALLSQVVFANDQTVSFFAEETNFARMTKRLGAGPT